MTDKKTEALKLALEALEYHPGNYKLSKAECAEYIAVEDAIREALAEQPAQQPQGAGAKMNDLPMSPATAAVLVELMGLPQQPAQQEEPVAHSIVAGALFDFIGWLTSRNERLVLSSTENAAPAADAIKDFAHMRNLNIDDAKVRDWQEHLTSQPAQQQEPVAKVCHDLDGHIGWNPNLTELPAEGTELYTSPPASKPLPEHYTVLEQALTRLQKRYADLEGKVGKPLTKGEIIKAQRSVDPEGQDLCGWSFTEGVRWAERHRGITGEQK